jgi:hypothetical protein
MPPVVTDFFVVRDRNAVGPAQLRRKQLQQPRHAGGLQVMAPVVVDGAAHRRLDRVGRVEADVALIEPERVLDRVHHVADANDAAERNGIEQFAHFYAAAAVTTQSLPPDPLN